jgi:hypothetical protein
MVLKKACMYGTATNECPKNFLHPVVVLWTLTKTGFLSLVDTFIVVLKEESLFPLCLAEGTCG